MMEIRWIRTMSRGHQRKIPAESATATNAENNIPKIPGGSYIGQTVGNWYLSTGSQSA